MCFFPVDFSLLIVHFLQVLLVLKFILSPGMGSWQLEFKSQISPLINDLNSKINSRSQAANRILKTNNYNNQWFKLRQRDKSRVNSSQMRFLRSLSRVTLRDWIKSKKIRKQVEEIIDDIQNYQQKWNQHVLRMPENRLPRKSLQY